MLGVIFAMKNLLEDFLLLNSSIDIFTVLVRILLAAFFGGIIGNERGKHGSQAGLRTHILVCLGAAMTALAGIFSSEVLNYNGDPFRIAAQVVSGIGFLGAGMIIVKSGNTITGLTTAAGMWTTATIGIALGMGFYSGASLLMLACVFTAAFLTRIERKRKNSIHIYLEIKELSLADAIVESIKNILNKDCYIEVIPPKSGIQGNLGIFIATTNFNNLEELQLKLQHCDGLAFSLIE